MVVINAMKNVYDMYSDALISSDTDMVSLDWLHCLAMKTACYFCTYVRGYQLSHILGLYAYETCMHTERSFLHL